MAQSMTKTEKIVYLRDELGLSFRQIAYLVEGRDSKSILKVYGLYKKKKERITPRNGITPGEDNITMDHVHNYKTSGEPFNTYSTFTLKRRGLLSYDEEILYDILYVMRILYDRYVEDTPNKTVWKHIEYWVQKTASRYFKKRPGTTITSRLVAYFYIILIRIMLDTRYKFLLDTLHRIREHYPRLHKYIRGYLEILS